MMCLSFLFAVSRAVRMPDPNARLWLKVAVPGLKRLPGHNSAPGMIFYLFPGSFDTFAAKARGKKTDDQTDDGPFQNEPER